MTRGELVSDDGRATDAQLDTQLQAWLCSIFCSNQAYFFHKCRLILFIFEELCLREIS
jgi:hypothetical protein